MKVPGSISSLYGVYKENAKIIDSIITPQLEIWCGRNQWFFTGRIKTDCSFAQKIESGRYKSEEIDDVFACTVVVKNRSEIEGCINELKTDFGFHFSNQVPKDIHTASMSPHYFDFDSVRLYFRPPKADIGPNPYEEQLFEIQVKTLIEQAWSLASHDFHYKSDTTSWSRSRISSQIKALLDSAELAIVEAEMLTKSSIIQKKDTLLDGLNEIIAYFKAEWEAGLLPKDLKRLAENVQNLLSPIHKDIEWLETIIKKETAEGRGKHSLNLAPYWIVFQSIINVEGEDFFKKVKKYKVRGRAVKLSIIDEINIPPSIDLSLYNNFYKI